MYPFHMYCTPPMRVVEVKRVQGESKNEGRKEGWSMNEWGISAEREIRTPLISPSAVGVQTVMLRVVEEVTGT